MRSVIPVTKQGSNQLNTSGADGTIILPGALPLPPLYYRSQRVSSPLEGWVAFSGQIQQLNSVFPQFAGVRYFRQVFIYGISVMGNPPTANTNAAYYGFSSGTVINLLGQWNGYYSAIIQPPDGDIFDFQNLFVTGAVGDGVAITAFK